MPIYIREIQQTKGERENIPYFDGKNIILSQFILSENSNGEN